MRSIDLFSNFVHSYYISTKQQEDLSSRVDLWNVLCYLDKMRMMMSCIWSRDFGPIVRYIVALSKQRKRDFGPSIECLNNKVFSSAPRCFYNARTRLQIVRVWFALYIR